MQSITREERRIAGRKWRNQVSRLAQANWDVNLRKSNPIELLEKSEKGRVPNLLAEKHRRMSVSPFAYYRGSAPVMAADLAMLPHTGLTVQLCGDAHVFNLGSFTAPDGRIVFDINDFDETIPGPWEWDVKRMAASLVLVGREAGSSELQCREAVLTFMRSYRQTMRRLSEMPVIEVARYLVLRHPKTSPVAQVLQRAQLRTNQQALKKLARRVDGHYRFRYDRVAKALAANVRQALHDYSLRLLPERRHFFQQYQLEDVGFRVVGCGSVGMRDYIALLLGAGLDDPLLLQVKEQSHSAYAPYLPDAHVPENQGQRVAEGQRALQLQSDIFLGWTSFGDRDYLVRQLRDHKASVADADLKGNGLRQYAELCGDLLAKGHARSGDSCALFGYMGASLRLDKAVAKFAFSYADQTTRDWEKYQQVMRPKKKAAKKKGTKKERSRK